MLRGGRGEDGWFSEKTHEDAPVRLSTPGSKFWAGTGSKAAETAQRDSEDRKVLPCGAGMSEQDAARLGQRPSPYL